MRFWRDHQQDALYFIATLCVLAAGTITGIVLADIALSW
jgi:hypothetical protein